MVLDKSKGNRLGLPLSTIVGCARTVFSRAQKRDRAMTGRDPDRHV
jgi:hypothetical protein